MNNLMGELVIFDGQKTNRISNQINEKEIEKTAEHFMIHDINARIWEVFANDGKSKNLSSQPDAKKLQFIDENGVVVELHGILANSHCKCGCDKYNKFKSSALWKIDAKTYRTLVTYTCSDCGELKKLEGEFTRSKFRLLKSKIFKKK